MSGCAFSFARRCVDVPPCSYLSMTVLTFLFSAGSPALLIHRFKGIECQRLFSKAVKCVIA